MKHTNQHKLDFACLDCIMVHLEHKKKLMYFVREMANEFRGKRHPDDISMEEWEMISKAKELLEEIEGDNE